MSKLYLEKIKQEILSKTGKECEWVKGNSSNKGLDGNKVHQCEVLVLLEKSDIDRVETIDFMFVEENDEYEFNFYDKDDNLIDVEFVTMLWESEYEEDNNGYYMDSEGALKGVLVLEDNLGVTVEEIVESNK